MRTDPSFPVPTVLVLKDQHELQFDPSLKTAQQVAFCAGSSDASPREQQEPLDMADEVASLVRSHRTVRDIELPIDVAS